MQRFNGQFSFGGSAVMLQLQKTNRTFLARLAIGLVLLIVVAIALLAKIRPSEKSAMTPAPSLQSTDETSSQVVNPSPALPEISDRQSLVQSNDEAKPTSILITPSTPTPTPTSTTSSGGNDAVTATTTTISAQVWAKATAGAVSAEAKAY